VSSFQQMLRAQNVMAAIGDSRVAQIHLDGLFRNISAANHFGWGNALAGERVVLSGNWGVSGDRTDQMLARLNPALTSGAGWLYIHAGVNDIGAAFANYTPAIGPYAGVLVTPANVGLIAFANIKYAADAALLQGIRPLIVLDPGSTALTAAQIGQLIELNERIREYVERTPGAVLFDLPAALWLPTNSTTAIAFCANCMRDTTHQSSVGAYIAGKAFAALLQAIIPPMPRQVRNIIETPSANSLVSLMANPLFATTTGGTAGAGATGSVPASWTVQRGSGSGTQTVVVSTGAPADGSPGTELILTCTFSAAGDEIRLFQDITLANWSQGDILQGQANIAVDASANLAAAYAYLSAVGDSTTNVTTLGLVNLANNSATSEAYTVAQFTEKMTVPNVTVKNFATFRVVIVGAAAGSTVVRIRQATVRKRFSANDNVLQRPSAVAA
jgi:hypothetical protein